MASAILKVIAVSLLLSFVSTSYGAEQPNSNLCAALFLRLDGHAAQANSLSTELEPVLNRWGGKLSVDQHRVLLSFLTEVFKDTSVAQRTEILNTAFTDPHSQRLLTQVDFEGDADMFVVGLISISTRFGGVIVNEKQTTSLWRLLEYLRNPITPTPPKRVPLGELVSLLDPVICGQRSFSSAELQELTAALSSHFLGLSASERHQLLTKVFGDTDSKNYLGQVDYDGDTDTFTVGFITAAARYSVVVSGIKTTPLKQLLDFLNSQH